MTPLELRCVQAMARVLDADTIGGTSDPDLIAVARGVNHSHADIALTALLSELDAAGRQLVPKEATREMVLAAIDRPANPATIMYGPIYRAMLGAAPKPFGEDEE